MMRKQTLKEALSTNVFGATCITTKLPETQTIKDKQRLADSDAQCIAEMKELLFVEIGNQQLSEKRIAEIRSILKPKTEEVVEPKKIVAFKNKKTATKKPAKKKEDLDTMLNSLLKSHRVSNKVKRIAQIILDREDARKRALADKALFERYENKSKEAIEQMRRTCEMIKNTGKQGR